MTPEKLAALLYTREVEHAGIKATPWADLHESHRRKWYVLAAAALSALRGPRTGEELWDALAHECWKEAAGRWEDVPHFHSAYNTIAATFATPPIPVGWPEGFDLMSPAGRVASGGFQCSIMARDCWSPATVRGMTKEEAEESARLTAWTLANQQPVWPAQVEEHWKARALRAEGECARRQTQIEKLTEETTTLCLDYDALRAEVTAQRDRAAKAEREASRYEMALNATQEEREILRGTYQALTEETAGIAAERDAAVRRATQTGALQRQLVAAQDTAHKQGWDDAIACVLEAIDGGEPDTLPPEVAGALARHYKQAHEDGGADGRLELGKHYRENLASYLTPYVRRALRPSLLQMLTDGALTPAEVGDALDNADKMAALLTRVAARAPF